MPRTGLTAEEVRTKAIDVTFDRMRRHGFDKVRLSDVGKDLGVSHAALYAHFADKAALLDAVSERWLAETEALLDAICRSDKQPLQKIHDWFVKLYRLKRERVMNDPELYRAFDVAAAMKKPFVVAHLAGIHQQLVGMIEEATGSLGTDSPQRQATLLYQATSAFHHPKLMVEHRGENRELLLKRLLQVLLTGLGADRKA